MARSAIEPETCFTLVYTLSISYLLLCHVRPARYTLCYCGVHSIFFNFYYLHTLNVLLCQAANRFLFRYSCFSAHLFLSLDWSYFPIHHSRNAHLRLGAINSTNPNTEYTSNWMGTYSWIGMCVLCERRAFVEDFVTLLRAHRCVGSDCGELFNDIGWRWAILSQIIYLLFLITSVNNRMIDRRAQRSLQTMIDGKQTISSISV